MATKNQTSSGGSNRWNPYDNNDSPQARKARKRIDGRKARNRARSAQAKAAAKQPDKAIQAPEGSHDVDLRAYMADALQHQRQLTRGIPLEDL